MKLWEKIKSFFRSLFGGKKEDSTAPVEEDVVKEETPKEIIPSKYNLLIIIEDPQLGIRPIKLVKNGPKILFFIKILVKASLPTYSNKTFKIKVMIIRKTNIFKV